MGSTNESEAEACGRCAMTTVVDVAGEGDGSDAYGEDRIEVPEDEMRRVSPHVVAMGRLKQRLNRLATRLTYGSR